MRIAIENLERDFDFDLETDKIHRFKKGKYLAIVDLETQHFGLIPANQDKIISDFFPCSILFKKVEPEGKKVVEHP